MPLDLGTCKACAKSFNRAGRDPLWYDLCWDHALDDHCSACFQKIGRAQHNWSGMTARVHWLAFTARCKLSDTVDAVCRSVYTAVADEALGSFRDLGHGGNGYERCQVGPYGVRVYSSDLRDDHHVVIPGSACDVMTTRAVLGAVAVEGRSFTRIDVALDGVCVGDQPLKPRTVYDLCRDSPDNVRTRVKLGAPPDEDGKRPENLKLVCSTNGDTCYVGSKDSDRILRVYDSRGFCRMELQATDKRAQQLAEVLDGKHPRDLGRAVVGYITGFIDFVKPWVNKDRAPRLDWWAAIVKDADRIMPALPAYRPHLDQSWRVFRDQWVPTFALFMRASGGDMDVFDQMLSRGSSRLSGRHETMLKEVGGEGAWTPTWES